MNLEDVECFLAVVEEKTQPAAANKLKRSQSYVSDALKRLEKDLDAVLIERRQGTRRMRLTAAGQRLVPHARQFVATGNELKTHCRQPQPVAAPIRIGCNQSVEHTWLVPWLTQLRGESPGVAFEVRVTTTNELGSMLLRGHLDLAIGTHEFKGKSIESEDLAPLPMAFLGSTKHQGGSYSLSELANIGLIGFQKDSTPWEDLRRLLKKHRVRGCRVDAISSVALMIELAEQGAGIATLPLELADPVRRPLLKEVHCGTDTLSALPVCLSWRQSNGKRKKPKTVEHLLQYHKSQPGARVLMAR